MSHIVFFCIPAHGHTNPTLEVVRELTARGHQVTYYSYEPFREKITAAGARFIACEAFDAEAKLSPEQGQRIGSDLVLSTRVLVDTTLALEPAVMKEMEQLRPDCIVSDSMAVWGKAVALKLGIPYICSTTTFAFNQHSSKIMKKTARELVSMLFSMGAVNKQIKRLQVAGFPVKNILDIIASDDNTPSIVYTSPQFQPCSETFNENYTFVGPSIRPASGEFEKKREKLVYVSMGTVNNAMLPLYRNCIEALKNMDCQAVLSVGKDVDIAAFGELPDNVSVYPQVDQIAVLSKADAFLTHCGMNSASEALYFGVPLAMLPQTSEQGGVAARVEQLGAGIRLQETSPKEIQILLETLLNDPQYRENAAKIRAGFRTCSGVRGAADKIERIAGGHHD